MTRRAYAQVTGVPPEYLYYIETAAYTTGVPKSWLAAVCERAQWNPAFKEMNYDRVPNSVRRFGIAGIWANIPEITYDLALVDPPQMSCYYRHILPAGWLPAFYIGGALFQGVCNCPGASFQYPTYPNLLVAGTILKDCGDIIQRKCGGHNELIFLRWQLGCNYMPQKDQQGRCIVPPGLPNIFLQEMQQLVVAQGIYAEYFQEIPIVPPVIALAISANTLFAPPGSPITFTANAAGGRPPYTYQWDFGDGTVSVETTNPTTSHIYEAVGIYQVTAVVRDSVGNSAGSAPLTITISEEAPPPPPPGIGTGALLGLGILGLVGLVGLAALAKKDPREEARKKREKAAALRRKATELRAQGRHQEADALEREAARLEREATELERQAMERETEEARRRAARR